MAGLSAMLWGSGDGAPPHHPVGDQQAPGRWRPVWSVGHLVFQGGLDRIPRYSLTGGGFIPSKSFAGKEGLMMQPYVTPVSSISGGGFVPSRPNFLTALLRGAFEPGTS